MHLTQAEPSSEERLPTISQQIRIKKWKLIAFFIFGLFAIFYVPSLIPVRPALSVSYVFNYSNRAGVALVILFTTIAALWTKGMGLRFAEDGDSEPIPLRVLALSLLTVLCGCALMYGFAGRYGGFGESGYLIDRAWMLSRGKAPYVDFEFAYGLSFLYGPVFLQQVLSIGIASAYYIFWILNFLLGSVFLFFNVRMLNYPSRSKLAIYWLLFLPGLFSIVTMGINYTPLRFQTPIFFILVFDRMCRRAGTRWQASSLALGIAFTAVLLLISPETGIAFAFASICVFQFCSPERGTGFIVLRLSLIGADALLFWAAMKLHVFDTLIADAGGADSFPIAMAPHILLFFAALFFCACYVYVRFSEHRLNDNTVGLIAYSVPMLAAALGRCDPGHVFCNGAGIVIASLFYVSNNEKLWKPYKSAFVLFMCVLPVLTGLLLYAAPIGKVLRLNSLSGQGQNRANQIDLSSLYPSWHEDFIAPFGYKPNGIVNLRSERVEYGHFDLFVNGYTVAATDEKLSEMRDHPADAILLPEHYERDCETNVEAERLLIDVLFTFPYFGRAVHPESLRRPICEYVQQHYRLEEPPMPENFNYGLWLPKSLDHV
jgi:hypothetical protein